MTVPSRRDFLVQSSLTAAGALVAPLAFADDGPLPDGAPPPHHHGKAPPRRAPNVRTARSGDWSDAATWGGKLPTAADLPLIGKGHVVRFDLERAQTAGVVVAPGGALVFAARSSTLQCTGNVVIEGVLSMRPASAKHVQTIEFLDVKEQEFVGGGMDPLDSDVGLWVIETGKLDLCGAEKKAWTRAAGSVEQGAKSVTVDDASGWRVGDVIVIVPTDRPDAEKVDWDDATNSPRDPFAAKFERRTITAVDHKTITLDEPLAHAHAAVVTDSGKQWTAEVANLTRNVRIQGTATGRAHVFIRSSVPHCLRYVEARHLGPRNVQKGHRRAQLVLGRYALHFHHCYEGSRGTIVEGCAIYDTGNRVYVPHTSHGIAMRDNVAFNSLEAAFWWDFQESTHDTTWERNLIACVAANGIDSSSMGMTLGQGDGNVARGNVVVYGHHGDPHGHGGYVWDANNEGVWTFENNLSHSNRTGLFVWQNTGLNHTIVNHESYHDYLAIFHGAYANAYTYTGGYVYGGTVRMKATSGNASGVRFEKMTFDAAKQLPCCVDVFPSPATSGLDTNVFRQCTFRNAPVALLMDTFPISNENVRKHVDVILCDFVNVDRPTDFTKASTPDSWFRLQPARGKCVKIVHRTGEEEIPRFAPDHYGTGVGLTGRYFLGSDFNKLVAERIDSMVTFQQWSYDPGASPNGVHHRIKGDEFSVRWTGHIEPQFTEDFTFRVVGGAGFRLWIDNRLVIDSWTERADNTDGLDSAPLALTTGRRYALRLETFNTAGARGCQLYWTCPSLGRFIHVPQSQLYPEA
jgi:hypothetical protein